MRVSEHNAAMASTARRNLAEVASVSGNTPASEAAISTVKSSALSTGFAGPAGSAHGSGPQHFQVPIQAAAQRSEQRQSPLSEAVPCVLKAGHRDAVAQTRVLVLLLKTPAGGVHAVEQGLGVEVEAMALRIAADPAPELVGHADEEEAKAVLLDVDAPYRRR